MRDPIIKSPDVLLHVKKVYFQGISEIMSQLLRVLNILVKMAQMLIIVS